MLVVRKNRDSRFREVNHQRDPEGMSREPSAEKKRALRLTDNPKSKTSKLLDFDSANPLLYKDQSISIDGKSSFSTQNLYVYHGLTCKKPAIVSKKTDLKYKVKLLPRRQRTRTDPLDDEVYVGFHRRMTKEEKSMTGSDRTRMLLEIENLKEQLRLIQQHDWVRHLPRIVMIQDRKDSDEMARKRKLMVQELRRLLGKFADWDERNARLLRDAKNFERGTNGNVRSNGLHASDDEYEDFSDDSDDADENILAASLEKLREKRELNRRTRGGHSVRIFLRNGYDILQVGDHVPRIVESNMYIN